MIKETENRAAKRDLPKAWHDYAADKFRAQDERMEALEAALLANTVATARVEANTTGIVDMMNSWDGAMRTIESIGKFLKPLTYVVSFCSACLGLYLIIKKVWEPK